MNMITNLQVKKILLFFKKNIVNSISFAPHELGLILACASSDCSISIHSYKGILFNS